MSKLKREADRWPVPSDWDRDVDGYMCYMLCVPNSRQWRGIVDGQISDLAYGRNYNRYSGTITDAQEVAEEIFETMCAATCDDILSVLACICEGTTVLAEKSGDTGQEVETTLSDGDIQTGPGEQFPDQETYFNAKCSVANGIFDTVRGMIQWLEDNDVDLLAGLFGGITSGLLVAIVVSGPLGWALSLVSGTLVALAGYLVRYSLSFTDMGDAMDDTHQECVLALYNASDALTAETNFVAAVQAGSPTITSIEAGLLNVLLSSEMVNQLFAPRDDVAVYDSPSPIDCGAALLLLWDFDSDVESWTFRDDSSANASATGSYNAFEEAIQADQIIIAGGSGRLTAAVNVSPTIAQLVSPGDSVQWDYSAPSDSIIVARTLTVFYTDATSEDIFKGAHSSAGTLVLTLTQNKFIETIELMTARSNGSSTTGYSFTTLTFEVRVVGA